MHNLGGCLTFDGIFKQGREINFKQHGRSGYKSLSNGCREAKCQQMLSEEVAYVKTPGILLGDNEGCEFLVKNKQVSLRIKHIDIAMHSIREFSQRTWKESLVARL